MHLVRSTWLTSSLWWLSIKTILSCVWTMVKLCGTNKSSHPVSGRMWPHCGQEQYQGRKCAGLIPSIAEIGNEKLSIIRPLLVLCTFTVRSKDFNSSSIFHFFVITLETCCVLCIAFFLRPRIIRIRLVWEPGQGSIGGGGWLFGDMTSLFPLFFKVLREDFN